MKTTDEYECKCPHESPHMALVLPKSLGRSSPQQDTNISWFHGRITRDAAEHILRVNGGKDGTFLLRESTSSAGDYVLSLIHDGKPIHYQIRRHGDDAYFSIDEGPIVHGLEMLVSYYQESSSGLVSRLGLMCKGQPPPPESRRHGRTNLLHRATKEGDDVVVSELLRNSYHSLDAKNQEGQTAVHLACIMGHEKILRALLNAGANVNCRDSSGLTPLHYACRGNKASLIKLLLEHSGATAHIRSLENGWVPLHEAASHGYVDVIKILLDFGVPCHPRSNDNETPLTLAIKGGHSDCVKVLQNYRPPPATSTRDEWFHNDLNREQACSVLQSNGLADGMFLVRRSIRKSGVYVLSTVSNTHIYHFEIHKRGRFYFIDDGPYLESLEQLIDYFRVSADGLPAHLTIPIQPKEKTPKEQQLPSQDTDTSKLDSKPTECIMAEPNLIRRESLHLGPPIGDGEFGSVLSGIWMDSKNNRKEVAIKTLREEHIKNGRYEFIREVEVMVGLHHRCIVQLLGVCLGPPLMMVQEFVPMGSMLDYLLDYPDQVDPETDLKRWAAQIALGMMYLESKRFVHRDLAARNILLESKKQVKISDFGLSRSLRDGSEYYKATSGGRWPIKWYAPESVNFGTFSHGSDVWSYGITLWEMYSYGEQPYGEMTGAQVIQLIEADQRLSKPEMCPDNIYSIMMQCWSYKPEKRPIFSDLYKVFTDGEDNSVDIVL